MTPQIILTLSPVGTLQAELPSSNGSRRVIPLDEAKPHETLDNLRRLLFAQRSATSHAIGTVGFPSAHQFHHSVHHQSAPAESCPFCNLGLRHANRFCNQSSSAINKKTRKTKRRLDARTEATLAAWAPAINPDDFGI
jgi:hypothetical protein